MAINNSTISGNLTRDAELRTTTGGTLVCSFTVAVNERRKNANGEWEDYPNFIDCILFGKLGEVLAPSLTKGTKVSAEGHLHQSRWEKDGAHRSRLELIVDEIELMSRTATQQGSQVPQNAPQTTQELQEEFSNTDIPF